MNRTDNPKIFISYSWSTQTHKDWVRQEIAERLIQNGIDVVLDQWDLKEGHDSYSFMEKTVNDPSILKVLIICDKQYCSKSNAKHGGVGTEAMIISPEIYGNIEQNKFIPIITEYNDDGQPPLPTYLKGRIYINFTKEVVFTEEFEKLTRNILDKPLLKKPPLGTIPKFDDDDTRKNLKIYHVKNSLKDIVLKSNKGELSLLENYLDTFITSLESYRLKFEITNDFDEVFMKSIDELRPLRDDFVDVVEFSVNSIDKSAIYDLFFSFFERLISFAFPPESPSSWNKLWYDNYRFFMYELSLYFITILMKYKKFNEVNFFLENYYFNNSLHSSFNKIFSKYYIFYSRIATLEEHRKSRLELRWKSVTAKTIEERATLKKYHFDILMQTDFILFLKFIFSFPDYEGNTYKIWEWYPTLLNHAERHSGFELFLKAESHKHFENIKLLLNIKDKDDLLQKWMKANQILDIDRFDSYRRVSLSVFLNIENLDKF